jgi:Asp-tRNA(Asn)/Glu-tRNA(Gln) amidotransferase A subunit family amidase
MTGLRSYVSLSRELKSGKVTPRGFLDECLGIVEKNEPRIGAFVALNADGARKAADQSTARWRDGKPLSPVDGMPIAVKDVIETADMPTGQGSPIWEGHLTRRDSAVVRALREMGAIILGKTTTTEFAATHPWHKTTNPHDATRTPGGSSSGSAAAVGAGMVPAALGTQVVGSILRPASFCGCIGYKPSIHGVNRAGSYDHFSQSSQGALGATIADIWGLITTATARTGGDPGHIGVMGTVNFAGAGKPKRLAVLETGGWSHTTEGARKAFDGAKQKLKAAGVELVSRSDDPELEAAERTLADAFPLTQSINAFEGRWPLNVYNALDEARLSNPAKERLKTANSMTQRDYVELLKGRDAARAAYGKVAGRYDAFVTLGACGAAPKGLGSTGDTIMNVAASYLGCPAITLPLLSDENLPLGLQLMGGVDRDAALFDVASWVLAAAFNRVDLIGSLDA